MCPSIRRVKILLLLKWAREGFPSRPDKGGPTVRRAVILLMAIAMAMVVGGGVALAKTIHCDGGNCFGTDKPDSIFGTNKHDAIFAKKGGDFVSGRGGADNLNGEDGNDRVLGGWGDDWVKGGRHDDTVEGNLGNDRITGGSGDNVIRAADGMRDLIVCGDNSWNRIRFDRHLDRFSNCVFLRRGQQESGQGDSTASIIGLASSRSSASEGSASPTR
jgi:RTX calcium-binding nonapeptide repeat (4 copies)